MSQIKLTADSGGGTTSIKAPSSTTSNADVVLKLPVADGSSGQVLKTDGSGQLSFTSNAGTTINNQADNRLITCTGTTGTLNGESSLTYDGSDLNISNDVPQLILTDTNSNNSYGRVRGNGGNLILSADHGGATAGSVILAEIDGSEKLRIDSAGAVGIGTVGGTYSLELENKVNSDVVLNIKNSTNGEDTGIQIIGQHGGSTRSSRIGHSIIANGTGLQIGSQDNITFHTGFSSYAERVRIDDNGMKFNGDTAAANALDDYEEGTFTPVYNYSGRSFNYYLQTGSYVKIGKTVHFILGIGTSSTSGSGTSGPVKIDGLPFASNARSAVAIRATNFASDPARTATVESGATFMELIKQTSSGTTDMTGSSLSTSNFGNIVYAAGHYETNS